MTYVREGGMKDVDENSFEGEIPILLIADSHPSPEPAISLQPSEQAQQLVPFQAILVAIRIYPDGSDIEVFVWQ
ncbi:hypothetical protein GCM10009753_71730 [Streptantibioticus ferralitis]